MESGSQNKTICVLCKKSDETEVTGPLSSKESISAHQNCLLYASGIYCKNSPTYDDLFGFEVEDVKNELRRGRRLSCHRCKKCGATAGCDEKRCKRSYHYPCAIKDHARTIEDPSKGRYILFCKLHDPESTRPSSGDSERPDLKRPKRPVSSWGPEKCPHKVQIYWYSYPCGDIWSPQRDEYQRDSDSSTGSSERRESPVVLDSGVSSSPARPAPADSSDVGATVNSGSSATIFWTRCNEARWTKEIFSDLVSELSGLGERVQSQEASQQDYDVALKVLGASGRLPCIVTELEQDLEKQEQDLQKKKAALRDAKAALGV